MMHNQDTRSRSFLRRPDVKSSTAVSAVSEPDHFPFLITRLSLGNEFKIGAVREMQM